jgi:hypothetical protein
MTNGASSFGRGPGIFNKRTPVLGTFAAFLNLIIRAALHRLHLRNRHRAVQAHEGLWQNLLPGCPGRLPSFVFF